MKIRPLRAIRTLGNHWRRRHLRFTLPESVYFFTLHKCASVLMRNTVLAKVRGLEMRDYASEVYEGLRDPGREGEYEPRGYVYGPLRVSTDVNQQASDELVNLTSPEFVRDRISLIMVRDPRDLLVSAFYSGAYSHSYSPVPEVRAEQEARRERMQALGLDAYALQLAPQQLLDFERLEQVRAHCRRVTVLRYRDLVERFDEFADALEAVLPLKRGVRRQLYEQSRPREEEDLMAHRRSGKVGGFRGKLQPDTIEALNTTLRPVLQSFGFEE
ncbi:MAG: hypothetical protein AAGK14_04690 [Verrucomicrobiota bacterium]